jgi:intraflagellar transport protein 172
LIEFGSALEERDYDRAITLLESLEMTPETEGMWKSLSNTALKDKKLVIAERCAAAMGDISRARYLHSLNDIMQDEVDYGV